MSNTKLKKTIVYNKTNSTLFIVSKYNVDPSGGPAIPETTYSIGPLQGIDLSVIGLTLTKPSKCKHCNGVGKINTTQFGAHIEYVCAHCHGRGKQC